MSALVIFFQDTAIVMAQRLIRTARRIHLFIVRDLNDISFLSERDFMSSVIHPLDGEALA